MAAALPQWLVEVDLKSKEKTEVMQKRLVIICQQSHLYVFVLSDSRRILRFYSRVGTARRRFFVSTLPRGNA